MAGEPEAQLPADLRALADGGLDGPVAFGVGYFPAQAVEPADDGRACPLSKDSSRLSLRALVRRCSRLNCRCSSVNCFWSTMNCSNRSLAACCCSMKALTVLTKVANLAGRSSSSSDSRRRRTASRNSGLLSRSSRKVLFLWCEVAAHGGCSGAGAGRPCTMNLL